MGTTATLARSLARSSLPHSPVVVRAVKCRRDSHCPLDASAKWSSGSAPTHSLSSASFAEKLKQLFLAPGTRTVSEREGDS